MKNSRNLVYQNVKKVENGVEVTVKIPRLLKSKEVTDWLKGIESTLLEQFEKQGSPTIPEHTPVALWTDIVVASSLPVAKKDGDNIYTTIQETLQRRPKTKKARNSGIIGFVKDDNQIMAHSVWVRTKSRLLSEFATVYAWVMPEPYLYPMDLAQFMLTFYIPKVLFGTEQEAESLKSMQSISKLWAEISEMAETGLTNDDEFDIV